MLDTVFSDCTEAAGRTVPLGVAAGDSVAQQALVARTQAYLRRLADSELPSDGECAAWERFFDRYSVEVRRLVRYWRLSAADGDDCEQEIWADLIRKLTSWQYDPARGRFDAWLATFVRRKVGRFVYRRHQPAPLGDADDSPAAPDADPASLCLRKESRRLVRSSLSSLRARVSAENYRIVKLRWIDGRSTKEVADSLAISQEQVRYRLHRMKSKLRGLIERSFGGEAEEVEAGGGNPRHDRRAVGQ